MKNFKAKHKASKSHQCYPSFKFGLNETEELPIFRNKNDMADNTSSINLSGRIPRVSQDNPHLSCQLNSQLENTVNFDSPFMDSTESITKSISKAKLEDNKNLNENLGSSNQDTYKESNKPLITDQSNTAEEIELSLIDNDSDFFTRRDAQSEFETNSAFLRLKDEDYIAAILSFSSLSSGILYHHIKYYGNFIFPELPMEFRDKSIDFILWIITTTSILSSKQIIKY